jgi:hypothetical protein
VQCSCDVGDHVGDQQEEHHKLHMSMI